MSTKAGELHSTKHARLREYSPDNLMTTEHLAWGERDAEDQKRWRQNFHRDSLGRVSALDATYQWSNPQATTQRTTYTHFDSGWIRSQSDPKIVGPLEPPEAGASAFVYDYDRRGDQTRWTSSKGRESERAYYPTGMLSSRTARFAAGTSPQPARSYTYKYNANGTMVEMFDTRLERRTLMTIDAAERTTLVDERYELKDENGSDVDAHRAFDTTFSYDHNGNVTERRTDGKAGQVTPTAANPHGYSGGKRVTLTYDTLDRETNTSVTDPAAAAQRHWQKTYWPSGDVQTRTKPSAAVESYGYTTNGELARHRRVKMDNGTAKDQAYSYDKNGNRESDERGSHQFNSRDQLVRWTRAAVGGSVDYTLTGNGSVLSKTDSNGADTTYDYSGDRLLAEHRRGSTEPTENVDKRFSYDEFGSLTKVEKSPAGANDYTAETTYVYDAFERLIQENPSGTSANGFLHAYDGLDRRDSTQRLDAQGQQTNNIDELSYIGTSESLSREAVLTPTFGFSARTYDYDSSMQRLGATIPHESTGLGDPVLPGTLEYRSYSHDANNSVEGLETGLGDVQPDDRYDYDPYGDLKANQTRTGAAKANPFRFEGFYHNEKTNTYDMRARAYRPDVGKFLTQDRFESAAGDFNLHSDPLTQNRYAFAGGNPVNRIEWDGHQEEEIKGRVISTTNYRRGTYERLYRGEEPLKFQLKIPDIQGRRSGKLRLALFISECAPLRVGEGDCRGFNRKFDSARTRVTFVVDFRSDILTILINPSCGKVPRRSCKRPTLAGRLKVTKGGSGDLKIDYNFKNSVTPTAFTPGITGSLTLKGFRDRKGHRRLSLDWRNDRYPSLEAYYQPVGRRSRRVCRSSEGSITDLARSRVRRCDPGQSIV